MPEETPEFDIPSAVRELVTEHPTPSENISETQTPQPPHDQPAGAAPAPAHTPGVISPQDFPTDSDGNRFDPSVHAKTRDGLPSLTPQGKFRKRRGTGAQRVTSGTASGAYLSEADKAPARYAALGSTSAALTVQLGYMIGGDEWQPIKSGQIDEFAQLSDAYRQYYQSVGLEDFPPGVALGLVLVAYAGPRLMMPRTQATVGNAWRYFTGPKNPPQTRSDNAAHSDTRDDGEREDDTGEKPVS